MSNRSAVASAGDSAESATRFERGIDLARVRAMLAEARERAGLPAESVTTLNLVAIHFSAAALERGREALLAAGTLHPARLISLVAEPKLSPEGTTVRTSIVRPRGAGTPLERILLEARGAAVRHLESAVTGLLAPDVPLVVVWGGRPEGELLRHVVSSADRVIVDSGTRPLQALEGAAALVRAGAPLGDLAWARIAPWRSLSAEVLDLPDLREHRGRIASARVVAAGAPGPESALLAGWFASRLPGARVELQAGPAEPAEPPGPPPQAAGQALPPAEPLQPGQPIELVFAAPPATFRLRREKALLVAQVEGDDDGGAVVHRSRLPPALPGRLLGLELKQLSGIDDVYAAALQETARFARVPGPERR